MGTELWLVSVEYCTHFFQFEVAAVGYYNALREGEREFRRAAQYIPSMQRKLAEAMLTPKDFSAKEAVRI